MKAQDRAIRADENIKHYVLTGKLLPPNLRIFQIEALRFEPYNGFLSHIDETLKKNLTQKKIEKIKNLKPNNLRI